MKRMYLIAMVLSLVLLFGCTAETAEPSEPAPTEPAPSEPAAPEAPSEPAAPAEEAPAEEAETVEEAEAIEVVGCEDTDGGKDYYTKGTVTPSRGSAAEDKCSKNPALANRLTETFCTEKGTKDTELYDCPEACVDGACVGADAPAEEAEPEAEEVEA